MCYGTPLHLGHRCPYILNLKCQNWVWRWSGEERTHQYFSVGNIFSGTIAPLPPTPWSATGSSDSPKFGSHFFHFYVHPMLKMFLTESVAKRNTYQPFDTAYGSPSLLQWRGAMEAMTALAGQESSGSFLLHSVFLLFVWSSALTFSLIHSEGSLCHATCSARIDNHHG